MALNPSAAYPSQVDTTDPTGYPYGKAKNVVAIGDGTGTPLEKDWVSDLFGLEQSLLAEAGLTPSGTPDKVGASQYLAAIKSVADARTKRALMASQAQNWPERATATSPGASANAAVGLCWAPDLGPALGSGLWVYTNVGTDCWSSEDGILWTNRGTQSNASTTNPWIAYGKINGVSGLLLSNNGNPTAYYTSLDGVTWSFISTTAVPANFVSVWSQSLGLWVLAGNSGAVSTSPSGLANTWTARTTPAGWIAGSGGAKRIVWNGTLFVILPAASYNKVLTSPDGVTWTERTLPATVLWTGLAYSSTDSAWMATNSNFGSGAFSTDGLTWVTTPGNLNYTIGTDLAVLGSLWVMTTVNANYGGIAWSIDKGASWTRGPSVGNHRIATAGWNRIFAGDGRFMVAHVDGFKTEFALSQRL